MVDFTKLGNNASSFSFYDYTLDDLEKDDEFQKISERFLTSVGEKSDDIFEYLVSSAFRGKKPEEGIAGSGPTFVYARYY